MTVDCFSQFIGVYHLAEITSGIVITKHKHHFARHGIPDILISDNGPQLSSHQFKMFAETWSFGHETSSLGKPKSDGATKAAVKSVKAHDEEDPYLADHT